MHKTTEKKQYEKPKMKVQPVRAQTSLMACSEYPGGQCPNSFEIIFD